MKKIKYLLITIISILFLLTFNATTSRYMGTLEADNDVVAIPVLTLSNNNLTINVDNMLPGDTRDYDFVVSNKDEYSLNEILLSYSFTIDSDEVLPLTIKILDKNDEEILLTDNKTEAEEMPFGVESERKYKLRVIWDEKNNSYTYANKTSIISVQLRAEQVI